MNSNIDDILDPELENLIKEEEEEISCEKEEQKENVNEMENQKVDEGESKKEINEGDQNEGEEKTEVGDNLENKDENPEKEIFESENVDVLKEVKEVTKEEPKEEDDEEEDEEDGLPPATTGLFLVKKEGIDDEVIPLPRISVKKIEEEIRKSEKKRSERAQQRKRKRPTATTRTKTQKKEPALSPSQKRRRKQQHTPKRNVRGRSKTPSPRRSPFRTPSSDEKKRKRRSSVASSSSSSVQLQEKKKLTKKEIFALYRRDLPVKRSWMSPSSTFSSKSPRISFQKTDGLNNSSTKYNIPSGFDVPPAKNTLSSMKSSTPRFQNFELRELSKVPSPVRYEPKHPDFEKSKTLGFISDADYRFKRNTELDSHPAPNQYRPLKSFNHFISTKLKISSPFKSETSRLSKAKQAINVSYLKNGLDLMSKSLGIEGEEPQTFEFPKDKRFRHYDRFMTPPPGNYFTKFFENWKKKNLSSSFAQSERFSEPKKDTPSPTKYSCQELPESLYIPPPQKMRE